VIDPARTAAPRSLDADRYRVLERRDVRTAVEFELMFVPAFIVAELVLIGRTNPPFAAVAIVALLALAVLAAGWRVRWRRRPHPAAFAVGVIVFAMGVGAAVTTEAVASLMNGLFAVVVVGCAVWMPWSPRWHLAFLALAAGSLVAGLAVAPVTPLQVTTGVFVGVGAILTSGLGMWLVRRRHLKMWGQTLELRYQKTALSRTIVELEAAEHRVRRLEGILPICASCKRIRDGKSWQPVESFVAARSDAQFSHGICPECAARLYPDVPATLVRS